MSLLDDIYQAAELGRDRLALSDGQEELTYGQLIDTVERIAAALHAAGVVRGDHVAIAAPKSVWTVAATLATFRLGAVHVPLDASLPEARILHMLERSRPRVLVSDTENVAACQRSALAREAWSVASLRQAPAAASVPWPELTAESPAYCMFTSGSTGLPKGVVLGHGALSAFFAGIVDTHDVSRDSRCLNTAPSFFDVTVLDTWFPLTRGASVRLTQPADLFPPRLLGLLRELQITHMCMVAPIVKLVAQSGSLLDRVELPHLRRLMTGAESPDPQAVRRWLRAAPQARLLNGYGPTEATCVCTVHSIGTDNAQADSYPIGSPVPGVSVWLLQDDVPTRAHGSEGELLVGGPQLMLGYLGDAEQTAARTFMVEGIPHYRTGDLCRMRDDGALQFVGRVDDEVKVSGYRVHLGELTSTVLREPFVRDAFAAVVPAPSGASAIALAVQLADGAESDGSDLLAALRTRLPLYMVPKHLFVLPSFPSLPSGKVDGSALRRDLSRLANA